jgi:hypothetical protein
MCGARRIFELDQRCVMQGAAIDPDVTIAHHRLDHIEPIGLTKHAHDLPAVAISVDHIDEYIAVGDQINQSGARSVAVRLTFLRCVDVLQANIDVAALFLADFGRPHQEAVAVEDPADGAGEVAIVGARCRQPAQSCARDQQPSLHSKFHRVALQARAYSG